MNVSSDGKTIIDPQEEFYTITCPWCGKRSLKFSENTLLRFKEIHYHCNCNSNMIVKLDNDGNLVIEQGLS